MIETVEKIARENDEEEFAYTRKELLRLLPDTALLNRFEQAVINRAVRAVNSIDLRIYK